MKKSIAIVVILNCFLVFNSFAQVKVGLRGGLNVSNIVNRYNSFDFLLGGHAGLFMRFNSDEKVYFQPEVLFSMKGNTFRDYVSGAKYVNTLRLNYIDIPLMLGLKPVNGVSLLIGGQPSILANAKNITRYAGKRTVSSGKGGLRTVDFGAIAGVQFESKSGVDIGVRASYGLLPVANTSGSYNNHNLNFMATVGYAF